MDIEDFLLIEHHPCEHLHDGVGNAWRVVPGLAVAKTGANQGRHLLLAGAQSVVGVCQNVVTTSTRDVESVGCHPVSSSGKLILCPKGCEEAPVGSTTGQQHLHGRTDLIRCQTQHHAKAVPMQPGKLHRLKASDLTRARSDLLHPVQGLSEAWPPVIGPADVHKPLDRCTKA